MGYEYFNRVDFQLATSFDLGTHYAIIYHVHYPGLLFSHINIIMQIIYIKGTA